MDNGCFVYLPSLAEPLASKALMGDAHIHSIHHRDGINGQKLSFWPGERIKQKLNTSHNCYQTHVFSPEWHSGVREALPALRLLRGAAGPKWALGPPLLQGQRSMWLTVQRTYFPSTCFLRARNQSLLGAINSGTLGLGLARAR